MKYIRKFEKYDQKLIDQILDKIAEFGMDSLTDSEKEYLSNPDKDTINTTTSKKKYKTIKCSRTS